MIPDSFFIYYGSVLISPIDLQLKTAEKTYMKNIIFTAIAKIFSQLWVIVNSILLMNGDR